MFQEIIHTVLTAKENHYNRAKYTPILLYFHGTNPTALQNLKKLQTSPLEIKTTINVDKILHK